MRTLLYDYYSEPHFVNHATRCRVENRKKLQAAEDPLQLIDPPSGA